MPLEMREQCQRCQSALAASGDAFLCSYECTFCVECAGQLQGTCPNCAGELVARPRRTPGQARPKPQTVEHGAQVEWRLSQAPFLDRRYSRVHSWSFDGGSTLRASASPHVVKQPLSDASAVDPEEAFLAALSSCHMLWFLDLAAQAGVEVTRYQDQPRGRMVALPDGRSALAQVVLSPRVETQGAVAQELLAQLHQRAHAACFLANALRFPIQVSLDI